MFDYMSKFSALLDSGVIVLTAIVIITQAIIIGFINIWLNRRFLKKNTSIVQEIQTNFSQTLASHKYLLDQSLINYKSDTDAQLAKQIEPLKASLGKENIAFQITHTEYIKRQFNHVEELYSLIFQLHRHTIMNYYSRAHIDDEECKELYGSTDAKRTSVLFKYNNASFFLPQQIIENIYNYLNRNNAVVMTHEAYRVERKYIKSSIGIKSETVDSSIITAQQLSEKLDDNLRGLVDNFDTITADLRKLMASSIAS